MPLDRELTELTTTSPILVNFDAFDFGTGFGYKKFYMLGTDDSSSVKYSLVTDSTLISDSTTAAWQVGGDTTDRDFDFTFNKPITIANADVTINYHVFMSSNASGTFTVAWTIYHFDGSTETSIGTVTDTTSSDGDPTVRYNRTVKVTLTRKRFAKGDTLRLNAIVTSNQGAGTHYFFIDPSGQVTFTNSQGGTGTSSSSINVPFEVDE